MPENATIAITEDEAQLLKLYRELKASEDLHLPFMENISAGFGINEDRLQVELTLSKSRK